MKGRMTRSVKTITHPEYGDVEWIDTNDSGTEIKIRYWDPRDGVITRWVDWTLPKKES